MISVVDCVSDITQKIIAANCMDSNRVFSVFDEDDLVAKVAGLAYPVIGVFFSGIRKTSFDGKPSSNVGATGSVSVTLFFCFRKEKLKNVNTSVVGLSLLDSTRSAIMNTRSPTGHKWCFEMEAPVEFGTLFGYVQRWSTPIQLI